MKYAICEVFTGEIIAEFDSLEEANEELATLFEEKFIAKGGNPDDYWYYIGEDPDGYMVCEYIDLAYRVEAM